MWEHQIIAKKNKFPLVFRAICTTFALNMEKLTFTLEEKEETLTLYQQVRDYIIDSLQKGDEEHMRHHLMNAIENHQVNRNVFGLNPILLSFQTALLVVEEIGLRRDAVIAILLRPSVEEGYLTIDDVQADYGESVARILRGLQRIQQLYKKNPVIESENFRNLLLSFAEDMRVILIMIADRVNLMRQIRDTEQKQSQREVSEEAAYLYAPLAHKLGLYKLKSELEDLSLKYLEHDAYYHIKGKLSETKKSRDAYIDRFIKPIEERLSEAGLKFHIKGRTKSIHSIWQKMKNRNARLRASMTSLPSASSSTRRWRKKRCIAGRPLPSLPQCTNLTPSAFATGSVCRSPMAMSRYISQCWDLSRSGLRYRFVRSAWTRWQSVV